MDAERGRSLVMYGAGMALVVVAGCVAAPLLHDAIIAAGMFFGGWLIRGSRDGYL